MPVHGPKGNPHGAKKMGLAASPKKNRVGAKGAGSGVKIKC
jgi:hypothetical protein